MVEHLLEVAQKPRILYERIHPQNEPQVAQTSKNLQRLVERLKMREWVPNMQDYLMETIIRLRREVKFIEHLLGCVVCQCEMQLDIERYLGNRTAWYVCLENNEYLERRYHNCPRERDYRIGVQKPSRM